MTDRPRQDDKPTDGEQPEPKRPTLNKETIRDLDPDTQQAADIEGGRGGGGGCSGLLSGCV
jgi:hypothetical protein